MLHILLAWIYITGICWGWGWLLLRALQYVARQSLHAFSFPVICFAGLSVLAVLSGIMSIFMPLGGWQVQLFILVPLFITTIIKRRRVYALGNYWKCSFSGYHSLAATVLLLFSVLILIMSSWIVSHPDTLGYHIQTIRWIESYKAIPGLVHLHIRYGYQGLWYCVCALFDFSFTGTRGLVFLNSTVVMWFVFFIMNKVNGSLKGVRNRVDLGLSSGILYSLLLLVASLNYVQVRLTATSASADFIAALFVWLVIYLVMKKEEDKTLSYALAGFLSISAVTIKLSSVCILLPAAYCLVRLIQLRKIRTVLFVAVLGIVALIPFISRNIITSGYPVFPSPVSSPLHVDWKISAEQNQLERQYIKAYARVGQVTGKAQIEEAASMDLKQWVGVWWNNLSTIDKLLLCSLLLFAVIGIIFWRDIRKTNNIFPLIFFITAAAVIFWFTQAPDPRFGHGFIIPILGIVLKYLLDSQLHSFSLKKNILMYGLAGFILLLFSYGTYRLTYYFTTDYLIEPAGSVIPQFSVENCQGILMNTPTNGQPCGDTPLPCIYDNCDAFEMRGKSISDGFRSK